MLEIAKPIVLLLHVLFAFGYVAGYVATNVLTELARRTDDPVLRRNALQFSTRFDRLLNAPGGTLVGLTGIATAVVFGYSLLSGWVLVAIVLFVVIVATGIFFWTRVGAKIDRATAAGDDAAVVRELRRPRNVAVSRIENVVVLAIIVLMVLRPS
ncbi:MAG: DUF2269 domain-containing protein [Chloroflexota bacterium]|nr:DUF2269 domain-containing protein [Chloroflexota bacterium]